MESDALMAKSLLQQNCCPTHLCSVLVVRIVDMAKPMAISSFRYVPTSANQAADCLGKRGLSFGLISDVYDNVPIFFLVKISFGRCNAFW